MVWLLFLFLIVFLVLLILLPLFTIVLEVIRCLMTLIHRNLLYYCYDYWFWLFYQSNQWLDGLFFHYLITIVLIFLEILFIVIFALFLCLLAVVYLRM